MTNSEKTPPRVRAANGKGSVAWAIAGTALVTVLFVMVNYVSFRRYERWDLTRDGLFTLSGRTEQLLKKLDRPVDIYLFMSGSEPNFQELKELITRYRAKSAKITGHFVDPDREPSKFRLLAERFGVRVALQENGQTEAELAAVVVAGDKRWSITRDDLVDLDLASVEEGPGKAKINVKTEQALSGAIVQVTSGRATKVCFSTGHGEWSIEAPERSLAAAKEELKRDNVELAPVETRGQKELAKTCDAIYVLGPQKPFSAEESAALKTYLDAGGSLLLALDPIISGEQLVPTGLESLAEAYGVHVDNDVVVELDAQRLLSPSPVEHFLVAGFGDHPSMRPLSALGAPVVMHLARSLTLAEGGEAEALMKSSDKAYGETVLGQLTAGDDLRVGDGDIKGPVTIAAAVATGTKGEDGKAKGKGGRLVVMGDSDWLSPNYLQQAQVANVDLLSSLTGFLAERDALISIAPRKINAQAIMITEDGLLGVLLRVLVLMPLAAIVLGVGVWWQRRS